MAQQAPSDTVDETERLRDDLRDLCAWALDGLMRSRVRETLECFTDCFCLSVCLSVCPIVRQQERRAGGEFAAERIAGSGSRSIAGAGAQHPQHGSKCVLCRVDSRINDAEYRLV